MARAAEKNFSAQMWKGQMFPVWCALCTRKMFLWAGCHCQSSFWGHQKKFFAFQNVHVRSHFYFKTLPTPRPMNRLAIHKSVPSLIGHNLCLFGPIAKKDQRDLFVSYSYNNGKFIFPKNYKKRKKCINFRIKFTFDPIWPKINRI